MANQITSTIEGVVVSWAEMTLAEKKDALTARLNSEINTTSSSWVKARDTMYLAMISYANEWLLNKVAGWIS